MCTMIAQQIKIEGSGKGTAGWFKLAEADVSYDHPFDAPFEHALNLDFVNESMGSGARVAVELSPHDPTRGRIVRLLKGKGGPEGAPVK